MANSLRLDELERRVRMDPASIAFAALAEEYRREGRLEEAIATCSTGLRRHPSYLSAHVTLGRACVALGRIDEGRAEFEHVLRLAPENLAAIRGLAEIHTSGERAAEQNESALALAIAIPHHTASAPPALEGLEHFLGAIFRARGVESMVSLAAR
jgi:tetratricopeptide (TPR) repeat protein